MIILSFYEQFYFINQIDNEKDTVTYGRGKSKDYWEPDTKRYRLWDGRNKSMTWHKFDYAGLMDNKMGDVGRLLLIMQSIDYDNLICIYDKTIRKFRPIRNKEELINVVNLSPNSSQSRAFVKRLFDKDIVKKMVIVPNTKEQEKIERYFLNPLITMREKGISIMCYKLFREHIIPFIPQRAIENLDKHLLEIE